MTSEEETPEWFPCGSCGVSKGNHQEEVNDHEFEELSEGEMMRFFGTTDMEVAKGTEQAAMLEALYIRGVK